MVYNTRLYLNTGFNLNNIPDSQALLETEQFVKLDLDSIWTYQDINLGTVKVKASYDAIYGADYCKINDKYYFITSLKMLNPVTCELTLMLDSITTIELSKILDNISSGWCNRRHVNDDTLFSNILPEPFLNSEELELDFDSISFKKYGNTTDESGNFVPTIGAVKYILIATTVNLDNINNLAQTYTDEQTQDKVTVPINDFLAINRDFTYIGFNFTNTEPRQINWRQTTGFCLYMIKVADITSEDNELYTRYVKAINNLFSLGLESAIQASYYILGSDDYMKYTYYPNSWRLKTIYYEPQSWISKIPVKWPTNGYQVKNNKTFAINNSLVIYSPISGDNFEIEADKIVSSVETLKDLFLFTIYTDASPSGSFYLTPTYFYGQGFNDALKSMIKYIKGGVWPNATIAFNGASGQYFIRQDYESSIYRNQIAMLNAGLGYATNTARDMYNTLAPLGETYKPSSTSFTPYVGEDIQHTPTTLMTPGYKDPVGSGLNVASSTIDYFKQQLNLQYNRIDTNKAYMKSLIKPPTIMFKNDNSLSEYLGNGFCIIRYRFNANDTKKFDRFLTQYGYAVSEPLTKECFTGRKYFNYIECENLVIAPIYETTTRLVDDAINRLQAGVRIWHTKVNKSAFDDNPIVEVS